MESEATLEMPKQLTPRSWSVFSRVAFEGAKDFHTACKGNLFQNDVDADVIEIGILFFKYPNVCSSL